MRKRSLKVSIGASVLSGLLIAATGITGASAEVAVDSEGKGFVGKGDVQAAFGWNNAQLQKNANNVSFSFEAEQSYTVVCEWTTGPVHNRVEHEVTHKRSWALNSEIAYEARKKNQFTGFLLNGVVKTISEGKPAPNVGEDCPNGNSGEVTQVSEAGISSTGTSGLFVTSGGIKLNL
jgi:hypothetical protein